MADDNDIYHIPIKDLRQEPGAHELPTSLDMEAYLKLIKAVIQEHDLAPELEAIRRLPLEGRLRLAHRLRSKMGPCRLRKP